MVGAQGLLFALTALADVGVGAVLRSNLFTTTHPSFGAAETTASANLMTKRHEYHYEILVNRYPDFHCEHKSLEDNPYHDSIGVDLKTKNFHNDIAQSECLIRDRGGSFSSVKFNWEAHLFGSEHLHGFGHCRLYVYADSGCEDAIHFMDWANAEHNLQQCYPVRAKDGREPVGLRLECRRRGASW